MYGTAQESKYENKLFECIFEVDAKCQMFIKFRVGSIYGTIMHLLL